MGEQWFISEYAIKQHPIIIQKNGRMNKISLSEEL